MCFLAGAEVGKLRAEAVIKAVTDHANDQGKALVVEDFPGSKVDMEQLQNKLAEDTYRFIAVARVVYILPRDPGDSTELLDYLKKVDAGREGLLEVVEGGDNTDEAHEAQAAHTTVRASRLARANQSLGISVEEKDSCLLQ